MIYALDTMIISELRKSKPHGGVLAWFAGLPASSFGIPAFVFLELQTGVEQTRERDPAKAHEIELWIETLEAQFTILPLDAEVARETARLTVGLSRHLLEDAAIAATARVHGLTVATRNTRDFQNFNVPLVNPFLHPR